MKKEKDASKRRSFDFPLKSAAQKRLCLKLSIVFSSRDITWRQDAANICIFRRWSCCCLNILLLEIFSLPSFFCWFSINWLSCISLGACRRDHVWQVYLFIGNLLSFDAGESLREATARFVHMLRESLVCILCVLACMFMSSTNVVGNFVFAIMLTKACLDYNGFETFTH